MVYKCVVPNCGVIYPNSSKIILHRFPADEVLRRQWMKSCAITTHLISYRVCDNHFLPEDIKDNGRLMPNAVPSIQLGVNLHLNSENLSQTNISTNNNSKPNGADSPQRSDTSTSLITNISPTQTSIKYPSCFNDLTVEHFSTPKRAKIHLEFAKQKYNDVLKKLSKVQDMYLKCINNKKQEDSNHLTENASQLIKMPSLQVKIEKEEPIIALPQESTPMRTTRPPVYGLNLNRMPSLQVKIEKEEPIIALPQESTPMRTTRPPVYGLNLNRMPSLQVKIEKEEPIIALPQESTPMRTTRPPVYGLNLNRMPSLQVKIEKEEPIIALPQESTPMRTTRPPVHGLNLNRMPSLQVKIEKEEPIITLPQESTPMRTTRPSVHGLNLNRMPSLQVKIEKEEPIIALPQESTPMRTTRPPVHGLNLNRMPSLQVKIEKEEPIITLPQESSYSYNTLFRYFSVSDIKAESKFNPTS